MQRTAEAYADEVGQKHQEYNNLINNNKKYLNYLTW